MLAYWPHPQPGVTTVGDNVLVVIGGDDHAQEFPTYLVEPLKYRVPIAMSEFLLAT